MALDANWIDYWAGRYRVGADEKVLNQVGPGVRQRERYDREDFMAVCEWKSPRARHTMASNADELIRDISSTALAAPLPIQHRILTLLNGVGVPMASSLLMVWRPEEHTVIDVRAVKSLVIYGEIADPTPKSYPSYMEYLKACRRISQRCGRSLRMVDRALYRGNGKSAEA